MKNTWECLNSKFDQPEEKKSTKLKMSLLKLSSLSGEKKEKKKKKKSVDKTCGKPQDVPKCT